MGLLEDVARMDWRNEEVVRSMKASHSTGLTLERAYHEVYRQISENRRMDIDIQLVAQSDFLEHAMLKRMDDEDNSREYVLAVVYLVNLKCEQTVKTTIWSNGWLTKDAKIFQSFFDRVVQLLGGGVRSAGGVWEYAECVAFVQNASARCDIECVKTCVSKLVSFDLWRLVSNDRVTRELALNPVMVKHWEKNLQGQSPKNQSFKAMGRLVDEVLSYVDAGKLSHTNGESALLENTLLLFIELLGGLETRRFITTLLWDKLVVSRIRTVLPELGETEQRVAVLVDRVHELMLYGVDNHTGQIMDEERRARFHSARIELLQRVAFRHFQTKLQDFAFASISAAQNMIASHENASKAFEEMTDEDLKAFVNYTGIITVQGNFERALMLQALVDSQKEMVPSKTQTRLRWRQPPLFLSLNTTKSGRELITTKHIDIDLQVLCLEDYLNRLARCSFIDGKSHVKDQACDAIRRLQYDIEAKNVKGWSRMAAPVLSCKFVKLINGTFPSDHNTTPMVLGELEFSLASSPPKVQSEWDNLADQTALFLVRIVENGAIAIKECIMQRSVLRTAKSKHMRRVRFITAKDSQPLSEFHILVRPNGDLAASRKMGRVLTEISMHPGSVDAWFPPWLRQGLLGLFENSSELVHESYSGADFVKQLASRQGLSLVSSSPHPGGGIPQACKVIAEMGLDESLTRVLVVAHSEQTLAHIQNELLAVHPRISVQRMVNLTSHANPISISEQVQTMLRDRLNLLAKVDKMARILDADADVAYTCETAQHFYHSHVAVVLKSEAQPFKLASLFPPGMASDVAKASIRQIFDELSELRAFELLEANELREKYILCKQSKVVLATTKHLLERFELIFSNSLGMIIDSIVMVESTKMTQADSWVALCAAKSNLRRLVLFADHKGQFPSGCTGRALDTLSLFDRFHRHGVPIRSLGPDFSTSSILLQQIEHRQSNPGLKYPCQFINVANYGGKGEVCPSPGCYYNLGEAEYIVTVYQYMRLLGYPSNAISIVTPFAAQRQLIKDIVLRKCATAFGLPRDVVCLDKMQGWQNDHVLVSLVRTNCLGPLLIDERFPGALQGCASRGIYIFGRAELFRRSVAWDSIFHAIGVPSLDLQLVFGENPLVSTTKLTPQQREASSYTVESPFHAMAIVSHLLHSLPASR